MYTLPLRRQNLIVAVGCVFRNQSLTKNRRRDIRRRNCKAALTTAKCIPCTNTFVNRVHPLVNALAASSISRPRTRRNKKRGQKQQANTVVLHGTTVCKVVGRVGDQIRNRGLDAESFNWSVLWKRMRTFHKPRTVRAKGSQILQSLPGVVPSTT